MACVASRLAGLYWARMGVAKGCYSTMLEIFAILIFAGVMFYFWYRNDLRRLTRDYACTVSFNGDLESCIIRFPLDEASTDTMLGANSEGLFMTSSSDALKKNRHWSFRYHAIRIPIFIPWQCVQIRDAKFPMLKYLRFNVASNKATFFVPREAGRRLLKAAGRSMTDG